MPCESTTSSILPGNPSANCGTSSASRSAAIASPATTSQASPNSRFSPRQSRPGSRPSYRPTFRTSPPPIPRHPSAARSGHGSRWVTAHERLDHEACPAPLRYAPQISRNFQYATVPLEPARSTTERGDHANTTLAYGFWPSRGDPASRSASLTRCRARAQALSARWCTVVLCFGVQCSPVGIRSPEGGRTTMAGDRRSSQRSSQMARSSSATVSTAISHVR